MRHWTLDEATAELVEVAPMVARVRELVSTVRDAVVRDQIGPAPSTNGVSHNGHGPGPAHPEPASAEHATETELRALLSELDDRGIIVRDPQRGLIDFPALSASGETYLLCWLDGEAAIEWWHWPDAGFAGRTPISSPPE